MRGEVSADAVPEVIVFEAIDTEFPSVYRLLVAFLVFVDEVEISLDCDVCPLIVFQLSMHGEFPHVIDCTVNLVC